MTCSLKLTFFCTCKMGIGISWTASFYCWSVHPQKVAQNEQTRCCMWTQRHVIRDQKSPTSMAVSMFPVPQKNEKKTWHTPNSSSIKNTSRPKACKSLREPQHTLRAYPMNPQTPEMKPEFLHKLLVEGFFWYVPFGVCWKILSEKVKFRL